MFCAALAGLLLIGVALTQFGGKPAAPAHRGLPLPAAPAFPPPAGLPVPAAGSRSSEPAPARSASRPPTTSATTRATTARQQRPPVAATAATTHRSTSRPTRTQPATAPVTALKAGSAVSLELADAPGYRVRHRDFRGRTDRIGTDSSALERADARFVVRPGLADGSCVSFESSNYPGSYLRHRDFRIRLDRADRTRLFARDATFCPETRGRAGVVALRSHNYPDRFLTEDRSLLGLTPATTGTATQFVVRPPL